MIGGAASQNSGGPFPSDASIRRLGTEEELDAAEVELRCFAVSPYVAYRVGSASEAEGFVVMRQSPEEEDAELPVRQALFDVILQRALDESS
jgi:hypothetical protein